MKRILFLISTLDTGGAQRAFANMSLTLPEGWECDFLLNSRENIAYDYKGKVFDLGIRPPKDTTNLIYLTRVFIKRLIKLRELKRTGDYCACISGLTSSNMANAITRVKDCLGVTSIRNHTGAKLKNDKSFKGRLETLSVKLFLKLTDATVCVSENARLDLIENYGAKADKAFTVYNGYPLEEISKRASEPLSEEEERLFEGRILVNVGRLGRQKNQAALIRVFKLVCDRIPDAKLIILGEGSREEELRFLATELGLEDRVIFWGFEKNPYRVISRCDCFVMPSLFEGFPNALAESLCLGIPVVSSDCDSGPREILAPDTDIHHKVVGEYEIAPYGILCPIPGEEDEPTQRIFADAVVEILQNEELRKRLKDQSLARMQDFTPEFTTQKWIDIISRYTNR